jgi:phosphomethylpyrimidine synthase
MRGENAELTQIIKSFVTLKSGKQDFRAGSGYKTLIMALVGANRERNYKDQIFKLDALEAMVDRPEIVSDLTIFKNPNVQPLWEIIATQTPFVAATLPIYTVKVKNDKIDKEELLDIANEQIESGVGLLTIHPTPTEKLVALSKSRLVPWTSRGGGIVIRDMLARSWQGDNIYLKILPEIVSMAKKYGTVLSIGASFRSANIFDSCDLVQQNEIKYQAELASYIKSQGVDVIIESPGHARPSSIKEIASLLKVSKCPIMPLGPIPTDIAIGNDHIASSIGATLLGLEGCAHIIAAVTREEHTGGIPTLKSTIEGVIAARIAAHIIDIELLGSDKLDYSVAKSRAENHTCVLDKSTKGCSRCTWTCPL